MLEISVLFTKHALYLTLHYCLQKFSGVLLTEAADEGGKAIVIFFLKTNTSTVNF